MGDSGGVYNATSGSYQPWACYCGQTNSGPGPCSRCLHPAPAWAGMVVPVMGSWRPGPLFIALGIVSAVLLISGLAALVTVIDNGDTRVEAARTLLVTTSPPATASPTEMQLAELMRFVESARGLTFNQPVKVTLLEDGPFRDRFAGMATSDESTEDEDDAETSAAVLQALGLIEPGTDLAAAFDDFAGDAVAGFYDPKADDLVVRGAELTPGIRGTLVHELTHALQDQNFDIQREDLDGRDDESAQGFTGLVEGDAVRIERQYFESLPEVEQKAAEREESEAAAGISPDLPEVLLTLVYFPYIFGPEFATAVVTAGGQARLDAAYSSPPSTSEHLLHPEIFLAGNGPAEVTAPKASGKKIDEGVIGELGLLLVLRQGDAESQNAARKAAEGWGGDRYVAWRDGKRTCVRSNIVMDSPSDTDELRDALTRLSKSRKGVTVRGAGPITFTSCA